MKRRNFIQASMVTGAGLTTGIAINDLVSRAASPPSNPFQLNYAPHFGMFRHHAGEDLIDQIDFMHDMGFRALEDNGMKGRSTVDQEKIARRMSGLDMTMGVFVGHTIHWKSPGLTTGKQEHREIFLREIRESVEVAKRVNAKWMTIVPGHVDLRQEMSYQTAHVIESLKQASAILEPHGLVMVLEPLNFRDHPGLFLTKISQAYEICKAVDSPACKILDDLYHQQITEGNLIPNIDLAWDEIAYFQVGDHPGRKEPTTGEINYLNIFRHIQQKGFNGIIGMEHGNAADGKTGEELVIRAYREVDAF